MVPEEDRAIKVLRKYLGEAEKKGLVIEEIRVVENRGNLMITWPGETDKQTVAFVGSHLDVVPAERSRWDRDPFKLVEENGMLYGRGTTDCLGHVAMLAMFMKHLALAKVKLRRTVSVLFIADEENGAGNCGVERVAEMGKMEFMKNGPVYWLDCADSQPCIGK